MELNSMNGIVRWFNIHLWKENVITNAYIILILSLYLSYYYTIIITITIIITFIVIINIIINVIVVITIIITPQPITWQRRQYCIKKLSGNY